MKPLSTPSERQPMPLWLAAWAVLYSIGVGTLILVVFYGK